MPKRLTKLYTLFQKGGFKKEFKLGKALMIGINGETRRRLETKSGTKINLRPLDDEFVQVTIKGSSKNCDRAHGLFREIIVSVVFFCKMIEKG